MKWIVVSLSLPIVSLLGGCQENVPVPSEVDDGLFVYSDLDNFQTAHQAILEGQDPIVALQQHYFDQASAGLREFAEEFSLDARTLSAKIEEYPRYYGSLVDLEDRLRALEPVTRAALERFSELVPQANIPPTYYVIGALRAGGTGGRAGMLIGAEIYAADQEVDLSEFENSRRLYPTAKVPHLVAHELTHYVQVAIQGEEVYGSIYRDPESLLELSIREGSAELMALLSSGAHINPEAEAYGTVHERELWNAFQVDIAEPGTGDWMFYKPQVRTEWPVDLGYWIGMRITQSYYENAHDKTEAIQEILGVTDYELLLEQSRYGESFE